MAFDPVSFAMGAKGSGGGGGSGGGVLVVGVDLTTMTLDKTWQEIHDADLSVIRYFQDDNSYSLDVINGASIIESNYVVATINADTFSTNSANGYPVFDNVGG